MPTAMMLPAKFSGRLEKLAIEAGSTPEKMLDYVMRDGFEYTEHFVREVKKGIADADAGRTVPHEEAMIRLQTTINLKNSVERMCYSTNPCGDWLLRHSCDSPFG